MPIPNKWQELSIIGVPMDYPRLATCVFVNSATGAGMKQYPPGKWNVVDCNNLVPLRTKAVALSFFLIITHGNNQEDANLTVMFRRHGETRPNNNYTQQVIEPFIGGGVRANAFEIVPLSDDLKFDICWGLSNSAPYPAYSSYGLNIGISAYFK